jgi:hypothetical protein
VTTLEPETPPFIGDIPVTEVISVAPGAPVFVDTTGRRSRLLRRLAYGFGALVMLYGGLISVSLVGGPVPSSAVLPLPGLEPATDAGDKKPPQPGPTPAPTPSLSPTPAFAVNALPRSSTPAARLELGKVTSAGPPPVTKPTATKKPAATTAAPKPSPTTSRPVESTTVPTTPATTAPTTPATTPIAPGLPPVPPASGQGGGAGSPTAAAEAATTELSAAATAEAEA